MVSEFISMVSERDPELAQTLARKIEDMRAADAALVRAAEKELAELRRSRPKLGFQLREGHSINELFDTSALPDPALIESHMRLGLKARLIVERLERRHHE
jgi:hypothetical protein